MTRTEAMNNAVDKVLSTARPILCNTGYVIGKLEFDTMHDAAFMPPDPDQAAEIAALKAEVKALGVECDAWSTRGNEAGRERDALKAELARLQTPTGAMAKLVEMLQRKSEGWNTLVTQARLAAAEHAAEIANLKTDKGAWTAGYRAGYLQAGEDMKKNPIPPDLRKMAREFCSHIVNWGFSHSGEPEAILAALDAEEKAVADVGAVYTKDPAAGTGSFLKEVVGNPPFNADAEQSRRDGYAEEKAAAEATKKPTEERPIAAKATSSGVAVSSSAAPSRPAITKVGRVWQNADGRTWDTDVGWVFDKQGESACYKIEPYCKYFGYTFNELARKCIFENPRDGDQFKHNGVVRVIRMSINGNPTVYTMAGGVCPPTDWYEDRKNLSDFRPVADAVPTTGPAITHEVLPWVWDHQGYKPMSEYGAPWFLQSTRPLAWTGKATGK